MLKAIKRLEKLRKRKIRDEASHSRRKRSIILRNEHLEIDLGESGAADNANDIADSDSGSAITIFHQKANVRKQMRVESLSLAKACDSHGESDVQQPK